MLATLAPPSAVILGSAGASPYRWINRAPQSAFQTQVIRWVAWSEALLFQVVHIEPVVNDAVARQVLRDVVLHVFLELGRQVAQAHVPLLVVPGDDFRAGTFLRVPANPFGNLVVRRAGGHEGAEGGVVDA